MVSTCQQHWFVQRYAAVKMTEFISNEQLVNKKPQHKNQQRNKRNCQLETPPKADQLTQLSAILTTNEKNKIIKKTQKKKKPLAPHKTSLKDLKIVIAKAIGIGQTFLMFRQVHFTVIGSVACRCVRKKKKIYIDLSI